MKNVLRLVRDLGEAKSNLSSAYNNHGGLVGWWWSVSGKKTLKKSHDSD